MAARFRQVNMDEVQQWCEEFKISSLIETSSKTATNVTEAFNIAVQQWKNMERISERESRAHGDTIDLTKTIRLSSNRFCCSSALLSGDADDEANNSTPRRRQFRQTNYQL